MQLNLYQINEIKMNRIDDMLDLEYYLNRFDSKKNIIIVQINCQKALRRDFA